MEKKCYNCMHCNFYFEEIEDDYYEYWDCELEKKEFDYDEGVCDEFE